MNFSENENAGQRTRKILVVEDNRINQVVVKSYLEALGYNYDVVGNGEDALTIIKSCPMYDLVLLDVGLPGISGGEVCRRLSEGGFSIPIIAMSAHYENEAEILFSGASLFLSKPYTMNELGCAIKQLLGE